MKIRGIKLARKTFNRPKEFSITWLLPNFLLYVLWYLVCKHTPSMLEIGIVIIFIIIAAVFDLLDGRVARF